MHSLRDHHVLITGGGTGIGAAIARCLSKHGAKLSIAGRRIEPLQALAQEVPNTTAIVADVTRESDCTAMAAAAHAAHGPIDIVIANAGAAESAPFAKTTLAQWQRMLDVNLTGAFLTAQATLHDVTRSDDAARPTRRRIIFIASMAGLKGYGYVAPYVAAKHGVVGLTRALASEFARSAMTVNAICPGFVATPMLDASVQNIVSKTGRDPSQALADLTRGNPQSRVIAPAEVAETVAWLCSSGAASVTGQAIAISGGET
jgi:NAD(P)-dependent dehydrogenase (short-subunit alcohol dehydrogenase family)